MATRAVSSGAALLLVLMCAVLGPRAPARAEGRAVGSSASSLAQVRFIYRGLAVQPPHGALRAGHVRDPLYNRYGLQTQHDQRASVGFQDGTVVHFNQNTSAVLVARNLTTVQHGEVAEYLAPGTDHRVDTAAASSGAIGTTFDIRTDGNRSVFTVLHGALQVANTRGTVVVKSGHKTTVVVGQAPQPPTPADAKAVFAWNDGIPTPDLGEDVGLDANGGSVAGYSSQREDSAGRWHADHINDGLLTEGWETAQGSVRNQWVKLGFEDQQAFLVSDIIIDPSATHGDPSTQDLREFDIRVSQSGLDESDFATVYRGICRRKNILQHFHLPVPVRARYVELRALDNWGSPDRLAVAELEVVAVTALFDYPTGVALDRLGNLYVADKYANAIDKVSPRGSILARWGSKGHRRGQFIDPTGIALDASNNVYVADSGNDRIQKLSPRGRTLATWGTPGYGRDQLQSPAGVAVGPHGDIYIADDGNFRLVKLSASGKVIAVSGKVLLSAVGDAEGLAVDASGNVYVGTADGKLLKLSPQLRIIGQWSGSGQIPAPSGIALDRRGNLYVADQLRGWIVEFTRRGNVVAVLGEKGGLGSDDLLWGSNGLAVDPKGHLYVAEHDDSRILKLAPNGQIQARWGRYGTVAQALGDPSGLAIDSHDNVYVTDDQNNRIQERDADGHVLAVWGYRGKDLGQFNSPSAVAVDAHGEIYVADGLNDRVQELSQRGPIASFGSSGDGPGQFFAPNGIAVDGHGHIYVLDGNGRVAKFSTRGRLITSWGKGDGKLTFPIGIATDRQGNVYVTDKGGLKKFSPEGHLLATLGGPGSAVAKELGGDTPYVTVGVDGTIYLGAGEIIKLSPLGKLLAHWLPPGKCGVDPLAVDSRGNIYGADPFCEKDIVKLSPKGEVLAAWT